LRWADLRQEEPLVLLPLADWLLLGAVVGAIAVCALV
jgi:hypothetical protein